MPSATIGSMSSVGTSPLQWPAYDQEQIDAVVKALQSGRVNYWTGQEGREFEKEFSAWCGSKHSIAVANGTVSLQLIVLALGLQPGDEVITTPRTFVASSSAMVLAGLKPVMADICLDSGNITPETVAPLITSKTKAILPVHLGGWPCDMPGFCDLVEGRGIHLIEDCAQSHGAKIKGRHLGTFGIANSWSFCQDKIMTTGGEGGMVTCDDEELWKKMWALKDHGKNFDTVYKKQHPPGFRWLHEDWGTNWRMTEIQSALGRVQLRRMEEWHEARKSNALFMAERLSKLEALRIPEVPADVTHAWYRLYAYTRPEALKSGWSRDRIAAECQARGFNVAVGSCSEIYLEKCFTDSGMGPAERLPNARFLGENSLAFLTHPGRTTAEMEQELEILESVVREASR